MVFLQPWIMLVISLWDGQIPRKKCDPRELGFMDEPMAFQKHPILELFFVYSFIFASRYPIYVDSALRTDS